MSNAKDLPLNKLKEGSMLAFWTVSKSGYRITNDLKYFGEPKPRTDPPFIVPNSGIRKVCPLLGNKLLHRNFADLDCDKENDILKFANEYGLLGNPLLLAPPSGGEIITGESLSEWKSLNNKLGLLLAIWNLVKAENAGKLGQFITWSIGGDRVQLSAHWVKGDNGYICSPGTNDFQAFRKKYEKRDCGQVMDLIASKYNNPELLKRWHRGNVIKPALFYVCREVNKNLDSRFSFKILPFMNKNIYTMPTTLESAIWLMFAYEISGKSEAVQCPLCSEWFERYHKREIFCSKACKQKDYRRRKKEGAK
jgi:hypothetical protein